MPARMSGMTTQTTELQEKYVLTSDANGISSYDTVGECVPSLGEIEQFVIPHRETGKKMKTKRPRVDERGTIGLSVLCGMSAVVAIVATIMGIADNAVWLFFATWSWMWVLIWWQWSKRADNRAAYYDRHTDSREAAHDD